jgi:hypothetical protein
MEGVTLQKQNIINTVALKNLIIRCIRIELLGTWTYILSDYTFGYEKKLWMKFISIFKLSSDIEISSWLASFPRGSDMKRVTETEFWKQNYASCLYLWYSNADWHRAEVRDDCQFIHDDITFT